VEIVTLVVPGFNDDPEELKGMARFLAGVSPDIPWHVTAFHPDYKMTDSRYTGVTDLNIAYEAGKEAGLHFIYPGNLPGRVGERESTFCPSCSALLIERHGFYVVRNRMNGSACPDCAAQIPGVWQDHPPRRSRGSGFPRPVGL
ncbi:MAG: radical SAM protein, partial [Candidatus Hydrogenedentes bacterium]|nr:radical SAM protein [Candidatus Hydrogenedentota bacterium]